MPEIISPLDVPRSDYRLTLTATYTATANGIDTNSATACLSRHGQAESGKPLIISLSGSALFSGGGQQITVTTDGNGEAIVYFTDTQPETVKVNCHYHHIMASADSIFRQDTRAGLDISAEVITNHSPANGIARNALRYSVYDTARNRVPSVGLTFSQDGSATLLNQSGQTNSSGQFTLELASLTAERVRVTARIVGNPLVANNTYVYFDTAPVLILISNTNINFASADGSAINRITFTLTQDGVGIPKQSLSFTSNSPTARITPTTALTDQNGQIVVDIQNTTSGETIVTARVESLLGIQPVNVIVTFTANFRIIYEVIANSAPANGIAQNQVWFTVTPTNSLIPQPGIAMSFSVTNDANLSTTQGTTDVNGRYLLSLTSNNVGPARVTATLILGTNVQSHIDMTFI